MSNIIRRKLAIITIDQKIQGDAIVSDIEDFFTTQRKCDVDSEQFGTDMKLTIWGIETKNGSEVR